MTRIFCIAEDPADTASLEGLLESLGFSPILSADAGRDYDPFADASLGAILVVCQQPDHHGLKLLGDLDRQRPHPPIVVLAGDPSVEHAVFCLRAGAVDYLPKPVQSETLALALEHARVRSALLADRAGLNRAVGRLRQERRLAGRSAAIRELRRLIHLVAPTDAAVLIEGESGTGKELVARALHDQSRRSQRPFLTINCAAMPEGLVESTLFGHEKGAFTGASGRAAGAFERAEGGTLFLDEISEMRLDLQSKLLRVIQEEEFERVGGRELLRADVRILASTNRRLGDEVAAGRFRADLYYRLHVVPLETPALRDRREDIPDLVEHFLNSVPGALGTTSARLPASTMEFLRNYDWPGNVRELRNAVHRAVILSAGGELQPEHFKLITPPRPSTPEGCAPVTADQVPLNLAELEVLAIARALQETSGHRAQAAKLLGISERTLRNRLNTPVPGSVTSGGIGRLGEVFSTP